jgi:glyoxylase-like metal-dependent hydrolase (beta-lactamase superfamily II)
LTLERIKAAGVDPRQIHYLLLPHTHGDHIGGICGGAWAQKWSRRHRGVPRDLDGPALNRCGIWVPLRSTSPCPWPSGDTTLASTASTSGDLRPGHHFDSVVYVRESGRPAGVSHR